MLKPLKCTSCIYYEKNVKNDGMERKWICKAFPDGIPYEIYTEKVLHYNKIEGQEKAFVYEQNYRGQDYERIIRAKIKKLSTNKRKLELQVISLLKGIIEKENIDNEEIKLVAFWLQYEDSARFFWRNYRKLNVYVVSLDNEIRTIEVKVTSDFVKIAYDLLWINNVENHHSSMHVHLDEKGEGRFSFSIEHLHSMIRHPSINSKYHFLWSEKDYEAIKNDPLYKQCTPVREAEVIEIIKTVKAKYEERYIHAYKVFLHFYIRNILITPTEVQIQTSKLSTKKQK